MERTSRAVVFVALAAAGALALYVVHPIASGFHLPVGPDGPVYTWLARHAAVAGFGDVPGGGPGVPALTLTLGSMLGTVPLQTVYVLGPVLAVLCGLAGASALEAGLGPDARRAAVAVALTAGFAAYLAGGWLANVALVAALLAALGALSLASTSWRAVALAAALLAAGGMAHRLFLAAAVAILLLAVALGARSVRRATAAGVRVRDTAPIREAIAVVAGGGLAAGVLAWVATGPRLAVDTSQDGFLRRHGLRSLLADRYRERFLGDLTRSAVPVVGGFALGGVWLADDDAAEPGASFLRRAWVAWAAVTVAGVLLLAATAAGPANRVLQFAFFLPLAGAAGIEVLSRRGRLGAVVAAAAVALFVLVALAGWSRQAPAFEPAELEAVRTASRAIADLPLDAPVVFLVDTNEPAAAYHVTRAANVVRAAVDPRRIPNVHVAVASPVAVGTARPRFTGDAEHDALARSSWAEIRGLAGDVPFFVLRELNRVGYPAALEFGREVAPGVVLLSSAGLETSSTPSEDDPAVEGLAPALLPLYCAAAVGVLALLGTGWAMWGLRGTGSRAALLAAPSAGLAVAILGTIGAERVGLLPGSGGSLAVVVGLAVAGYVTDRVR